MPQIDYAKLAEQVRKQKTEVDYAALAEKVRTASSAPAATEPRSLLSRSTLDDFPVINMAKGAWNAVKAVPGAMYDMAVDVAPYDEQGNFKMPLGRTVGGMLEAQGRLGAESGEAFQRGDYMTAATKGAKYLLPVVGPMMDAGERTMAEKGVAEGIGELGANALMMAEGMRPRPVSARLLPARVAGPINPKEAAAVAFARERGVPLDLATATGSQRARNWQKKAANTWGGGGIADELQRLQAEHLVRVGDELAAETALKPSNPIAAGEGVRKAIDDRIRRSAEKANQQYGQLEAYEANAPEEMVPTKSQPVAVDPKGLDRSFILRWLADDLAEMPYQSSGRMRGQQAVDTMEEATSQEAGRRATYTPRVAGSPVQDTLNLAGITGTKAELADRIARQLRTGRIDPKLAKIADAYAEAWDGQQFDFDLVSDQTIADAGIRRRMMKSPVTMPDVSEPGASRFFPDQSLPEVSKPVSMDTQRLSVDLRSAKNGPLKAIRQDLLAQNASVPFMDGTGKATALRALNRLFDGPDFQPLSVTDKILGELKGLARGAEMPELRTQGQGVAAQAVKELDALVRARAAKAGPDVLKALEEGRAATVEKWATSDVRDLLSGEPGAVFRQLTQSKDVGLNRLRQVKQVAPEEMPKVARAFLEDLMQTATQEGGFSRADRLYAEWNKLGMETKTILFKNPALVKSLDDFFMLAKKIKENPNPSGTAQIPKLSFAELFAAVPAYAAAQMMLNPKSVKFLTEARMISETRPSSATRLLVANQISKAAQSAGVSLGGIPAFAGPGQPTTQSGTRK